MTGSHHFSFSTIQSSTMALLQQVIDSQATCCASPASWPSYTAPAALLACCCHYLCITSYSVVPSKRKGIFSSRTGDCCMGWPFQAMKPVAQGCEQGLMVQDICCNSQHTYAHAQQLLQSLGAHPQGARFKRLSQDMEVNAAEKLGHPIAWKMHQ